MADDESEGLERISRLLAAIDTDVDTVLLVKQGEVPDAKTDEELQQRERISKLIAAIDADVGPIPEGKDVTIMIVNGRAKVVIVDANPRVPRGRQRRTWPYRDLK